MGKLSEVTLLGSLVDTDSIPINRPPSGPGRVLWSVFKTVLDARYAPLNTRAGVRLTSAMTGIATATITDVTWDTEVSDLDGWHAGVGVGLIVPAGKAGRYMVSYNGTWSASPGTATGIACQVTGAVYEGVGTTSSVFTYWSPSLCFVRTFAAGDTLKCTVYQNSGTIKSLTSSLEIAPV